jgi:hypothetical protein
MVLLRIALRSSESLNWPGSSWKDITVSTHWSEKVEEIGEQYLTVVAKEQPGIQSLLLPFFYDIYTFVHICGQLVHPVGTYTDIFSEISIYPVPAYWFSYISAQYPAHDNFASDPPMYNDRHHC